MLLQSFLSLFCLLAAAAAEATSEQNHRALKIFQHWQSSAKRQAVHRSSPLTSDEMFGPVRNLSYWERCIYVFHFTAGSRPGLSFQPQRNLCGMQTSLSRWVTSFPAWVLQGGS